MNMFFQSSNEAYILFRTRLPSTCVVRRGRYFVEIRVYSFGCFYIFLMGWEVEYWCLRSVYFERISIAKYVYVKITTTSTSSKNIVFGAIRRNCYWIRHKRNKNLFLNIINRSFNWCFRDGIWPHVFFACFLLACASCLN